MSLTCIRRTAEFSVLKMCDLFLYLMSMCPAAFRRGLVYADKQILVTVHMCVGFVFTEFKNLNRLGWVGLG